MFRAALCSVAAIGLLAGPVIETEAEARTRKVKYAKSEVDKAVGKCVGTVLGGALLGALIAGKRDRAKGALAGAAVGGGICALIVDDAKRKDRLFEAQLRAAEAESGQHSASFTDETGANATVVASAGEAQMMPASMLVPVKYKYADSTTYLSPVLPGPEALCRTTSASLEVAGGGKADAPEQLICRTETGDWAAYGLKKRRNRA
ncbi:MAG: hypothetical protein V2I43_14620 [Parvularcula sp.]|jgi:hypothetical protein|nr:hypothetical protein [Parvularcula sp.]